MQTVNLVQGTPEWHAHRANHFNASDAPAAMGVSSYTKRSELLQRLHTGIAPDVDPATQRIFDDGHRFEALARPLAEAIIGDDLYPVTGTKGKYSASFDGLTMTYEEGFEHKSLNDTIRNAFADMLTIAPEHRDTAAGKCLPIEYRVQMEQQAMVSGCKRILFMASKWSGDQLADELHCWYYPDMDLRAKLVAAWAQVEADLANYTPPAVEAPKPAGKAPETLPALRIEVTGMVTASNLADFKSTALTAIRSVNRTLQTDQDFADAEQSVKWCEEVESRLKAAKEHALSQTASIDALFKTIDDISAEARKVRLELDKLVKARKEELRHQIVVKALQEMEAHCRKLDSRVGMRVAIAPRDFSGAIKGKRSLASIQDAVDTELANAKIAANELADRMQANIATLKGEAHDWGFLFPDLATVANKPTEDFANLLAARIQTHSQAEEQRKAREAEAAAKAAEAVKQAAQTPVVTHQAPVVSPEHSQATPPNAPPNDGSTIKLGDITARIAPLSITAAGLAELGFEPVGTEKSAKLYRESDFSKICAAMVNLLRNATAGATHH